MKSDFMATPYKLACRSSKDDWKFFHLQLRIQIEMALGILMQYWGILCKALPEKLDF